VAKRAVQTRMTGKDWTTLSMSALALILSSVTVYFNVVRTKDDLRVVVEGTPEFLLDYENPKFDISTDLTMTFINAGTRPLAILRVTLFLDQSPRANLHQEKCEVQEGTAITRPYDFTTTIVKAGEISSVQVKLREATPPKSAKKASIPLVEESAIKNQINVLGCLRFTVSTPENVQEVRDVPIFYSNVELYRRADGYFGDGTTPSLGPHILLQHAWPM
jgi:hypothetical protein